MRRKNIYKSIACFLAATLMLCPLEKASISALTKGEYSPSLADRVVSIHVDGSNVSNKSDNQFEIVKTVNSNKYSYGTWAWGDESNASISYATVVNQMKKPSFTYKINHKDAINDPNFTSLCYATCRTYQDDGTLEPNFYKALPTDIANVTLLNNRKYAYDYEYKGQPHKIDYTIPAGQFQLYNDCKRTNNTSVTISDVEGCKITAPITNPDVISCAPGQYKIYIGSYGPAGGGLSSTRNATVLDKATEYYKTTINLAELYPTYFAPNGELYIPSYKDIVNCATAPQGLSEYTIDGKKVFFEASFMVTSGSFIQVPNIDNKGNVTFYVENENQTAVISTLFNYKIVGGGTGAGGGTSMSYEDNIRKTVDMKIQPIEIDGNFVFKNLPYGTYTIKQTACDSNHTIIDDISFNISEPGLQKINITLKDKPVATPTATPTVTPTATPTVTPTATPTATPSATPTVAPTVVPTATPSATPTAAPTVAPTVVPTATPSATPTAAPTVVPTATPSATPTAAPTVAPTVVPTAVPSPAIVVTPTPVVSSTTEPSSENESNDTIENLEKTLILDENIDNRENELSPYSRLQLRLSASLKKGKTVNSLKWKKISNADSYIIYGAKCGNKLEKLATVDSSKTSWKQKNLKKGIYYKYLVAAVKDGKVICTSRTVHAIVGSKKYGNPVKITGLKKSIAIKKGSSKSLKAKMVSQKKLKVQNHVAALRYESSDTSIVTVSKKGKITAVGAGEATIYVYSQNGICKTVKVKVK